MISGGTGLGRGHLQLTASAPDIYTVFDNRQVQIQVINNRIAGFVRQAGGFHGVLGEALPLGVGTAHRVALILESGHMGMVVDGATINSIAIDEPVAAAEIGSHLYIGGDPTGLRLPGRVEDVRVSGAARSDIVPPVITPVSPMPGFSVSEARPVFNVAYSDASGINVASVRMFVNGVEQFASADLTVDATHLLGRFASGLRSGRRNLIEVRAADNVGNLTNVTFEIVYVNSGGGTPYEPDTTTVGLWHFDDEDPTVARDSSGNNLHGRSLKTLLTSGVLGLARQFQFSQNSQIVLPYVPATGRAFTFETWLQPAANRANLGDPNPFRQRAHPCPACG